MRRHNSRRLAGVQRVLASERGVGLLELLAVIAVSTALIATSSHALWESYQRNKARVVAAETIQVIRYARLKALKEKVRHRVMFHDESASTANTIEVQTEQSGSFVTLPGQVYPAPEGVSILGSGSTNSVDSVVVGTRGECQPGMVYIEGQYGTMEVIRIRGSCHSSRS